MCISVFERFIVIYYAFNRYVRLCVCVCVCVCMYGRCDTIVTISVPARSERSSELSIG